MSALVSLVWSVSLDSLRSVAPTGLHDLVDLVVLDDLVSFDDLVGLVDLVDLADLADFDDLDLVFLAFKL